MRVALTGALPLRSLAAERKLAGRWPPAAVSRPRLAAHRAGGEGGGEGRGGPAQGRIRRDGRHRRGGPVPLKARDGADLWPPWLSKARRAACYLYGLSLRRCLAAWSVFPTRGRVTQPR